MPKNLKKAPRKAPVTKMQPKKAPATRALVRAVGKSATKQPAIFSADVAREPKFAKSQVTLSPKILVTAKLRPLHNGTRLKEASPVAKASLDRPLGNAAKRLAGAKSVARSTNTTKNPSAAEKAPAAGTSVQRKLTGKTATKDTVHASATTQPIMIPAPLKLTAKTAVLNVAQAKSAKSKTAAARSTGGRSSAMDRGETGAGAAVRFPNNAPVPLAPVPTDGKPKKNLAGLGLRDLEHFRELLLAKRGELVGDMTSMEREALRSANGTNLSNLPLHMADMGTDNYEQEFTLGLVEKERGLLRELNRALAKIQDGTFGICEGTGKPINRPRLEAQPWARFSIEYARMMERGLVRR